MTETNADRTAIAAAVAEMLPDTHWYVVDAHAVFRDEIIAAAMELERLKEDVEIWYQATLDREKIIDELTAENDALREKGDKWDRLRAIEELTQQAQELDMGY